MRYLMASVRNGTVGTQQVAVELGISQRRVQQLYASYLEACACHREEQWAPGTSGGGHRREIPEEVIALWQKMLTAKPAAPYGFIASESERRCGFEVTRATVRRWALGHGLSHPSKPVRRKGHTLRWQCADVGALWQMDVTPHHWFGADRESLPLFDVIDDCSRVITGARLYPRECLLAYLDFLSKVFEEYGMPLALYVDHHSIFYTEVIDMLTYLGETLQYLDVSFKYASSPQAKGKIERQHLFWQKRLPSFFAAEKITRIEEANPHLQDLRRHHNENEIHRELGMYPQQAWRKAKKEYRFRLRPRMATPWWPYLWSIREPVKVSHDGMVLLATQRVKVAHPPGTRLTRCQHPDGSITLLANDLRSGGKPIVIRRHEAATPSWSV
jgi:transposase InsO family protein